MPMQAKQNDMQTSVRTSKRKRGVSSKYQWQYWLLLLLPLAYILIFHYAPMVGITIAFKDYSARGGVFGSPWVQTL